MKLGKFSVSKFLLRNKSSEGFKHALLNNFKILERVVNIEKDEIVFIGISEQFREVAKGDETIPEYTCLVTEIMVTKDNYVIEFKEITGNDKQPSH